jgi:hypothetical protein
MSATKKSIEIKINAKGQVEYEVKGVKGGNCFAETAFLDAALGGDAAIVDQQKTAEFYEQSEGYATQWSGEDKGE